MIKERMEALITRAVRGDAEDCLFYTEIQEEGFFFFISDYFSAYKVILGNYCFFCQSVMRGALDWEINPGFSSQPYQRVEVNGSVPRYAVLPDLPPPVIIW